MTDLTAKTTSELTARLREIEEDLEDMDPEDVRHPPEGVIRDVVTRHQADRRAIRAELERRKDHEDELNDIERNEAEPERLNAMARSFARRGA